MNDTLARQLIICCDGTNNNLTGGDRDTNVVRLCELLAKRSDAQQIVFYDPGVGNPGELPGATFVERARRKADRTAGLAFGQGIYENMDECYRFLMNNYQSGDQIFLFGFSRGAFTARSVAGLINMFGILRPHMASIVPTLLHTYFSDRETSADRMKKIAQQLSRLFADADERKVNVHFVGVWDTVASVGLPPFSQSFTARANVDGKRFLNVRQALALDEHRSQFAPRQYANHNGAYTSDAGLPVSLKQLWFPGAHCDVGGGYAPEQLALANIPMGWLVSEATACGLRLGQAPGAALSESEVLDLIYPPIDGKRAEPTILKINSELHNTPIWAVTGMKVRSPGQLSDDAASPEKVIAEEHPSVAQRAFSFPKDTVWATPLSWRPLLLWSLIFLGLYGAIGQMLLPPQFSESITGLVSLFQRYPEYLIQNLHFVKWQMAWWWQGIAASGDFWTNIVASLRQYQAFGSPRWALLWDLLLVLVYAQVLSRLCVAGFARGAGLQRVGQPEPKWLNKAGWVLPIMVLSDLAENAFTWLTITLTETQYFLLACISGTGMSAFALLKWLGLLGVIALICWPKKRVE
jgi:uncharacterized protein (DUF2235 family)